MIPAAAPVKLGTETATGEALAIGENAIETAARQPATIRDRLNLRIVALFL